MDAQHPDHSCRFSKAPFRDSGSAGASPMKLSRWSTLVFVALVAATAVGQSPVVRAHLEPSHGILVGQPIRLVVSVYVPNYFTGTPEFPEFEIENAIVVLPQDRPENSNTQIAGTSYAGITETY